MHKVFCEKKTYRQQKQDLEPKGVPQIVTSIPKEMKNNVMLSQSMAFPRILWKKICDKKPYSRAWTMPKRRLTAPRQHKELAVASLNSSNTYIFWYRCVPKYGKVIIQEKTL